MNQSLATNDNATLSRHISEEMTATAVIVTAAGTGATPVALATPLVVPTIHARKIVVAVSSDKAISIVRKMYFARRSIVVTDLARPVAAGVPMTIGPDAFSEAAGDEMEVFVVNTAAVGVGNNATATIKIIARA